MSSQILSVASPSKRESKSVWLLQACAALCATAAALYWFVILIALPGTLTNLFSSPSVLPTHFLAFGAGLFFVVTLSLSSARLFYLRRWAALTLAIFGWFSTFAMLRAFSGWSWNEWPLPLVLCVTLVLTAAIVVHWRRLERGF